MRTPSALRPLQRHSRFLLVLATASLLAACSRPAPPEEPVRSVKLLTVGVGALQSSLEYSGEVRARVDVRPYATEDLDLWIASDLTPGLDGRPSHVSGDHVLGISSAATSLAQLTVREPVGRALDLGTGCGVQALHLAPHADHVVATVPLPVLGRMWNDIPPELSRPGYGIGGKVSVLAEDPATAWEPKAKTPKAVIAGLPD